MNLSINEELDTSNPILGSGSTSSNEERDFFPIAYTEENALFAACTVCDKETHLILSGSCGGARWGKPHPRATMALSTNSLMICLNAFKDIFSVMEKMTDHVKYLKATNKLTDFPSMDANHYRTFSLEKNPRYQLTGLTFNNGSFGVARFFNPYLTTGKGVNELVLARNSLLNFPTLDSLYVDLKKVFDAAIVSFAKKEAFVNMTYYILSRFIDLPEPEFLLIVRRNKIDKKVSDFFYDGLPYLSEGERKKIVPQKLRFKALVSIDECTLQSVRIANRKFQDYFNKKKEPYFLGE